jgi:class 3 adenylate cyclase
MRERPDTKYARAADGVHIAYQTLGDGPVDLVSVGYGNLVSIDSRDEEPHIRRFEHRLGSFSRLIRFDPRGRGMSDPMPPGAPFTVEQSVEDVTAVLDAVGAAAGALFAVAMNAPTALLAAATNPDRVSSLVLVHGYARLARSDDYPFGIPQHALDRFRDGLLDVGDAEGGEAAGGDDVPSDIALLAPSFADDLEFREWWQRAGQRGASPASARAILTALNGVDVRSVLGSVVAPTLLIHREDCIYGVELSQFLADHLPNSRLVVLPGRDLFPFAGDSDAVLDEIEEFLTGVRGESGSERVLTTVLFTDIVGSTQRARAMGDRAWHDLLDRHDAMVREELRRFRGHEVKTMGDGVLATFDGPARAMRAAVAICTGARRLDVEVRAGLHTGEVEMRGDDVSGVAVHIAQRVSGLAGAGEVLVSRTVVDLVTGSGIEFADRGQHDLKGLEGTWQLFAVQS